MISFYKIDALCVHLSKTVDGRYEDRLPKIAWIYVTTLQLFWCFYMHSLPCQTQ